MSQGNTITVSGFVARDPEQRLTREKREPYTTVRLGSATRYPDRKTGEWIDADVSYFDVKCWRKLGENVQACLHKGDMVIVHGKLRTRSWVDGEGQSRTRMEINAENVGHNLAFGWSKFNRGPRIPANVQEELAKGEQARGDLDADDGYAGEYPEPADRPSGADAYELSGGELDATPAPELEDGGPSAAGDVPEPADERQLA